LPQGGLRSKKRPSFSQQLSLDVGALPVDLVQAVDVLQKIFTILAIIVGGIWAYYNFIRSRTYHKRVDLEVSPKIIDDNNKILIVYTVEVKNVGLSKVEIENDLSSLEILASMGREKWYTLVTHSLQREIEIEPDQTPDRERHNITIEAKETFKKEWLINEEVIVERLIELWPNYEPEFRKSGRQIISDYFQALAFRLVVGSKKDEGWEVIKIVEWPSKQASRPA
jgi:hypothetical protein